MKKIALFIGEVTSEYQMEVVEGISKEVAKYGAKCFAFTNGGVYGGTFFYAYGEKNIITVPYLEDYDGVIVAGDTFGIEGMYDDVVRLLEKEAKCPVVCIRQEDSRFYNVTVDSCVSMGRMVEHFIEHHGFKKICFMTGKLEMYDAQRRLLGYINAMQKHNIKVTPDMVFEGDYWRSRGMAAVEWFMKDGELPEAIVCANDYMAISVCNALYQKGYRVPEDVCVTGYDDVEEARYSIPSISSMHVSGSEMGRRAVQIIANVNAGKEQEQNVYLEVEPRFRHSCGCDDMTDGMSIQKLFIQKESLQRMIYHCSVMRMAFENQEDFQGLVLTASAYIRDFGYDGLYLCFCEETERSLENLEINQDYTERMHLRAIFENGECSVCDEEFDRRDILPEKYIQDTDIVYVFPFHEKHVCLGYIVLKAKQLRGLQFVLTAWIQSMGTAIENQRMYGASKELRELRDKYNRDALTGIGNRREAERVMSEYQKRLITTGKLFCIVSLDMDGLKIINDKYGHLEGDEALCVVAKILDEAVGTKGTAARIGGDEYLLCLDVDTDAQVREIIANVRQKIADFNATGQKPWELDVSAGYAFCRKGSTVLFTMQQADKNMYQEKRTKKNNRL